VAGHPPGGRIRRLSSARVSRAKIHRALRKLKYPHSIALEIATHSTVSQNAAKKDYCSLPFGFIQSPMLASLVLDGSMLGRTAFRLVKSGITLSIYMDDFIPSGRDEETLRLAREELEAAATLANFEFNPPEEHRAGARHRGIQFRYHRFEPASERGTHGRLRHGHGNRLSSNDRRYPRIRGHGERRPAQAT
jgi:Reverse transcriptase (RNA-dependent DNA polymerase)